MSRYWEDEYDQAVIRRERQEYRSSRGSAFFILYVAACAVVWIGGVLYCSYLVQQENTPTCIRQAQDQ